MKREILKLVVFVVTLLTALSCSKYDRLDVPKDTPECIVDYILNNKDKGCLQSVRTHALSHENSIEKFYFFQVIGACYWNGIEVRNTGCEVVCRNDLSDNFVFCSDSLKLSSNYEVIWER